MSPAPIRHVLVVGAGIGGTATARALRRIGVDVTLVERRAEPPRAGLGLNLPGNAVRVLADLGVADEVRAAGVPVTRREYRTSTGRLLFAVDEAAFWSDVAPSVCVRHGRLLDALARDQDVRYGIDVVAVHPEPDGVSVTFAGDRRDTFDAVIGADGFHSRVRRAVVAASARPSAMTASSWRFVVDDPGVACWTAWTGPTAVLLLIPVAPGTVYGYASSRTGGAAGADRRWLEDTFAGFPGPARDAVDRALADDATLHHAPVDELRLDTWCRGRVAVLGDAAHATGPVWAQGAAMALEDALVLAETLGETPDAAEAFPRWQARRRPRVEHVQAATDRMSRLAGLPGWVFRTVSPLTGPRAFRSTYGPLRRPA